MTKIEKVFVAIETVNEKLGRILCYALVMIMIIQVYEVTMRYLFDNPTKWAWDVNGQLFAGVGIMAGAYALLHDTHVRLDILYRGWSPRKKTIVDLAVSPIILLALCVVIWKGGEMAWWSWKMDEHVHSYFAPILWPVKTCFPLAGILMLLQAIVKYGRALTSLINPPNGSS